LYDPATGAWSATASLATARYGHTATLLPNGKVLVASGWSGSTSDTASAELYDPETGWTATGSLATARGLHTATLLPNGKVLVAGGGFGTAFASAELYDPGTGTWTATGSLATARESHTATLLPNGKVLVVGGAGGSGYLASAELYDIGVATSPPTLTGMLRLPNGSFQFGFTSGSGLAFTVLTTTNLSSTSANWTVLGSPTEISSGHYQFTDSQATNNRQSFYRVRSP
jgi:hypothetical protein